MHISTSTTYFFHFPMYIPGYTHVGEAVSRAMHMHLSIISFIPNFFSLYFRSAPLPLQSFFSSLPPPPIFLSLDGGRSTTTKAADDPRSILSYFPIGHQRRKGGGAVISQINWTNFSFSWGSARVCEKKEKEGWRVTTVINKNILRRKKTQWAMQCNVRNKNFISKTFDKVSGVYLGYR